MLDSHLDALVQRYFRDLIEYFPPFATSAGIHDYDEEMPDGTPESMEKFRDCRRRFLDELWAIDPRRLSFNRRIDLEALIVTIDSQIFEDETHRRAQSLPNTGQEVMMALMPLFIKEFAPFEERLKLITARLEKVPRFVENSKLLLTDPVGVWLEVGVEETKGAIDFIKELQQIARMMDFGEHIIRPLDRAARAAVISLYEYAYWLCERYSGARSDFYMSPEDLETLIAKRRLGMNTDQMLRFGWETLGQAREMKRELASRFAPGVPVEDFTRYMRQNHPDTFEGVIETAIRASDAAREFVIRSGFATVPDNEILIVTETPLFARSTIPFGAYNPPGPYDLMQEGHYWLTPPPETEDGSEPLQNYSLGTILNLSVHEAYPGHHLQLTCANRNPSLARLLTEGNEFVEGWAHYCEEMVQQMGFSNEPEVIVERINDMIFRAARIIIDIKVSRGEADFVEACEFLHDATGFEAESCIAEMKRYTYTPGYQLSYLIGKKRIQDIQESIKHDASRDFNLKRFHDSMLYAGILPVAVMEKVVRHEFFGNEPSDHPQGMGFEPVTEL